MQQQVTVQQALQIAGEMLQAGRVNEAEPILQQVLQQFPNHAEAVHFMAYVANARQDHAAAENLLRRAISLNPNIAVYHQNLGVLLAATGRPDQAADSFRNAIRLDRNYPEPLMGLGLILEERKQLEEALDLYRRAVALNPNFAEVHCTMGDVFCKQDRLNESLACYEQALRINPNLAEALANRGNVFNKLGRVDDAIATTLRALQINPTMFHALRAMGIYLASRNQFDDSIAYFRKALELDPDSAVTWSGLAIAYLRAGRVPEAVENCRKSIQCDPKFVDPYVNLGLALTDLGQHEEALAIYEQSIKLDPNCDATRSNRAIIHLLLGDFEQGFADYERRWSLPEFKSLGRDFKAPRWDGSDPAGKTIIIWREQGLGDTIQCIRYAKLLAQRGAKVIAEVQAPIASLFKNVEGVSQVITREDPVPPADLEAPIFSLPYLFKMRADTIPADVPYIFPDKTLVEQWRGRVEPHWGFRVGIVWRGNQFLRLDYARSMTLAHYAPLAAIPNVRLFSLQVGPGSEQVATAPAGMNVIDLTKDIRDFSDTAALIAHLDLVISVDTAVVHLAAAMGKPTWVLTQKWPDWRWQLDREDSPWYPTVRVFRQSTRGEWQSVLDRVQSELRKISAKT